MIAPYRVRPKLVFAYRLNQFKDGHSRPQTTTLLVSQPSPSLIIEATAILMSIGTQDGGVALGDLLEAKQLEGQMQMDVEDVVMEQPANGGGTRVVAMVNDDEVLAAQVSLILVGLRLFGSLLSSPKLGHLASLHHSSEYSRLKFGPRGTQSQQIT